MLKEHIRNIKICYSNIQHSIITEHIIISIGNKLTPKSNFK